MAWLCARCLQPEHEYPTGACSERRGARRSADSLSLIEIEKLISEPGYDNRKTIQAIGKKAVEPLIRGLTASDPDVRRFSASCLEVIRDPLAVGPLTHVLEHDACDGVRMAAARALAGVGDKRGAASLVAALSRRGMYAEEYAVIAESLAGLGDTRAIEPLVGIAGSGHPELRPEADGVLRKLLTSSDRQEALCYVSKFLRDSDASQRQYAAELLGEIGDKSVLPQLRRLTAFWRSERDCVKEAASKAISRILARQQEAGQRPR